jgi:multiple antibiotic resistance protein
MTTHLSYLFDCFVSVFVIVDPFACVPVYLALTDRFGSSQRADISRKAVLSASVILMTFALTGMLIFKVFGITLPAFRIAGGILLLTMGLQQMGADVHRMKSEEQAESLGRDDVSVFPLAMPLLAGPGAISTVVLLGSKAHTFLQTFLLVVSVVAAMAVVFMVLRSAQYLFRLLGQTGLNLLTRVMGIILTAIAVQYVITGIGAVIASYR